MPSEQQIQKKILNYLDSLPGCYVRKIVNANKAGTPDILGGYKGAFFGIEVKTPITKKNVSKLQQYNLDQIDTAGGYALVAWEVEQVQELIKEIENDALCTSGNIC